MLIANDFKEIINCCNNINNSTYDSLKSGIEKNFELAQKHIDLPGNLKKVIENILK